MGKGISILATKDTKFTKKLGLRPGPQNILCFFVFYVAKKPKAI